MTTALPVATDDNVGGIRTGPSLITDLVVDETGLAATVYNFNLTLSDTNTAVGNRSTATGDDAVALGNGSVAHEDKVVSFGNNGLTRRLIYVAPGLAETDAANLGQLKGKLNTAGGTLTGGLTFATGLATQPYYVDKHIALTPAGDVGISVSSDSLNFVAPAGSQGFRFYLGEELVTQLPAQKSDAFISRSEHLSVLSDLQRQIDDLHHRLLSLEGR